MSCRTRCLLWLFALFLCTNVAHAQPRVSLLLGDAALRQALDISAALGRDFPALRAAEFRAYSSTRVQEQDLQHLADSDLVILQLVGRAQFTRFEPQLRQALQRGARVYAFGGSLNAEDQALGIRQDPQLEAYFGQGGAANLRNGLLYALNQLAPGEGVTQALALPLEAPLSVPAVGIYDAGSGSWFTRYDDFLQQYRRHRPGQPWVGFMVYQSNIVTGSTAHLDAVIAALEARGYNVLTVFGYPAEQPIEAYLLDEHGRSRVEVLVAASLKIGVEPAVLTPLLQRLDVPVINAISLYSLTREEWEASPVGMDIQERAWQLAMPEMAGLIQPTVFAAKQSLRDPVSGQHYVEEQPIPERVEMLARRVSRWIHLRQTPNHEKKVFLQYFNFPPGRAAVGAAYLNVLPESLSRVMDHLQAEGYDLSGRPATPEALQQELLHYGVNLPASARSEVDALARSGEAVLLPVSTYEQWFSELPEKARTLVTNSWGEPAASELMTWSDAAGAKHFVLPVRRYGKVLVGPQPSRGKSDDPELLYHDIQFPPPHQYIAFYLWLQKEFGADALFQFGTHGTHEWLPGREAGLGPDDAPDYLIQDLPNLYAFIMDNAGEGAIAMRRGMATMITHLTPPLDRMGLNPELQELKALLDDYKRAQQQSPQLAAARLQELQQRAADMGLLTDLGLEDPAVSGQTPAHSEAEELPEALHHYLEELSDRITPYGLHTFGKPPTAEAIAATAEAIVSLSPELDASERKRRIAALSADISNSAERELAALTAGLAGRYIPAGVGGDPLRTPEALPTGRNFYSFDPRRLPAASTYALGQKLADELVEDYRRRHGDYPRKLSFTLWGVETMRNEGVQEAQIMHLMGVRPVYDAQGVVRGVEAIAREELGRPRIDVTVIPSGLHRDLFSNVLALLDQAVSVALAQDEADNAVRQHTAATRQLLQEQGVAAALAERLAAVRLFTVPPGAYGTNMESAIERSDSWDDEQTLADLYLRRMGHLYGQGFWGDSPLDGGLQPLGGTLLRQALSGTQMTVHARSSNVFQVLDGDDPFASFGALGLAVRAIDGSSPEVMISNLADPGQARQESLQRFMGRELRSRYLNPDWIAAMQAEGYAGARFFNQVVQNLWGWQVTAPDAVDAAKWNELYETYVQDRYELGMEAFFREAGNLEALQQLMTRMLEAVRKGYWEASDEVVSDLGERVSELLGELQLSCDAQGCEDPILQELLQARLLPAAAQPAPAAPSAATPTAAPAASAAAAPTAAPAADSPALQPVQGYAMEVQRIDTQQQAAAPQSSRAAALSLFLLLLSFTAGYLGRSSKRLLLLLAAALGLSSGLKAADAPAARAPESIVVSATRMATRSKAAPAAVSVIDRTALQSLTLFTLDEALGRSSGVMNRRTKGFMDTTPSLTLRGLGNARDSLVLVDGVPQNDARNGQVNWSMIDSESVERMEVLRGPFSSLYGGSALGGVVSIFTRRPEQNSLSVKIGTGGSAGSAAPEQFRDLSLRGSYVASAALALSLNYRRRTTDGYPSTHVNVSDSVIAALPAGSSGWQPYTTNVGGRSNLVGHMGNNWYRDESWSSRLSYSPTDSTRLDLSYAVSNAPYGYDMPESLLRDARGQPTYANISASTWLNGALFARGGATQQRNSALNLRHNHGDLGLSLALGHTEKYSITQIAGLTLANAGHAPLTAPDFNGGDGRLAPLATARRNSIDLQLDFPLGESHTVVMGLAALQGELGEQRWSLRDWSDAASRYFLSAAVSGRDRIHSLYLQDAWALHEQLTLYLGARQDWWSMRGGLARSFSLAGDSGSLHYDKVAATAFSPKLSLVYRPTPQTTLRSSLGKAFRAPTLFEFFGTAQLGGTDYVGNPGLRPESLRSWELGIDHSFSNGIDALLTLYRSQLDERIATQTTDNISRPANLAAARIEGVELELKGALPYGLHWSLNYTLTDSAVTRDPQPEVVGKQLPQAPEQLYNIGLGWRHAVWDLLLHHSYQSKRFTNVANSDTVTGVPGSTDAFHLTDFKASYRINEQLQAGLGINNLFDAQYHQFYRSPGRFWFAELRYDY